MAVFVWVVKQCQIYFGRHERRMGAAGKPLDHRKAHLGKIPEDGLHERHTDAFHDRKRQAHGELSGNVLGVAQHVVLGRANGLQNGPGMGIKAVPGGGCFHPARLALEQSGSKVRLEVGDMVADRRLSHCKMAGGMGKIAVFEDRDEIGELPDVHDIGILIFRT